MTYEECMKFNEWLLENYGVCPEDLSDEDYDAAYVAYANSIH